MKETAMSKYRNDLPQLSNRLFMTDGGLETTLIFHEGLDLPCFASFPVIRNANGRELIASYYRRYMGIARKAKMGFILESPTWRASRDWGAKLGYSQEALAAINRDCIELLEELRQENETLVTPIVVSACIGPRGDGYQPGAIMTVSEAAAFHIEQIEVFSTTTADLVTAMTINNVNEAIGIARAAQACHMSLAMSFTVETDGRLPTGQSLREAIEQVDDETCGTPLYYMVNCAHPAHFMPAFDDAGSWTGRVRGLRANASRQSHAELDEATELDDGNPQELAAQYQAFLRRQPQITILGGCCGTDHRHVEHICSSCKVAA